MLLASKEEVAAHFALLNVTGYLHVISEIAMSRAERTADVL
jgi:hypothetical protein